MTAVPFSNVTSTSLSSARYSFARFSTLSGAGFFWATFFWAGLMAWVLPGIGFLATGLLGMAEKTSALIEAEATRKESRDPIGRDSASVSRRQQPLRHCRLNDRFIWQ